MHQCEEYLSIVEKEIFSHEKNISENKYIESDKVIGVEPFLLNKLHLKQNQSTNSYAFDAETTK